MGHSGVAPDKDVRGDSFPWLAVLSLAAEWSWLILLESFDSCPRCPDDFRDRSWNTEDLLTFVRIGISMIRIGQCCCPRIVSEEKIIDCGPAITLLVFDAIQTASVFIELESSFAKPRIGPGESSGTHRCATVGF